MISKKRRKNFGLLKERKAILKKHVEVLILKTQVSWGNRAAPYEVYRVTRRASFYSQTHNVPASARSGASVACECWQKDFAFSAHLFLRVRLSAARSGTSLKREQTLMGQDQQRDYRLVDLRFDRCEEPGVRKTSATGWLLALLSCGREMNQRGSERCYSRYHCSSALRMSQNRLTQNTGNSKRNRWSIKVKLSLCLTKHYAMKTYGGGV
jgi:hypothetical protein